MGQQKYDVAISFLSRDESIAKAFWERLGQGLRVFFYPRNQEDLAGTNGLESMRLPFLDAARLAVVLYRQPWGDTQWTGVESTAIQEGCLRLGWRRLFFIMLDEGPPPQWVPDVYVRFNYAEYGLEQAVGAIKARVQELGGEIIPLTAAQRAEAAARQTLLLQCKEMIRSGEGQGVVEEETQKLFLGIGAVCNEISRGGTLSIDVRIEKRLCIMRSACVSLAVALDFSSLRSELTVREFDQRLPVVGERRLALHEPRVLREFTFVPDLDGARQAGWTAKGSNQSAFVSTRLLAEDIVGRLIDLNARSERGETQMRPQRARPSKYRSQSY